MFIGPLLLLVVAPALRMIFLSKDTQISTSEDEAAPAAEAGLES
jgi:cobalt-zinc-cadmium resistance protein CzcA